MGISIYKEEFNQQSCKRENMDHQLSGINNSLQQALKIFHSLSS